MKKTFVLFALCLLVLLGGLIAAVTILHNDRDDIVVTAYDQAGDRSAAQGFTAQQSVRRGSHLRWDLTMDLGTPEESTTEFSYVREAMGGFVEAGPEDLILYLTTDAYGSSAASEGEIAQTEDPWTQMIQDVYQRTPEGELSTENVLLSDYFTYYPLTAHMTLPQRVDFTQLSWDPDAVTQAFQDFFRFPVVPGDTLPVTIDRTAGDSYTMEHRPGAASPSMETICAMTQEGFFFSFSPTTRPFPSFAEVPGGYGLYWIAAPNGEPHPDSLSCVYPLPEGTYALDLTLTPDGSWLVMTTGTAQGYACTVLDTETMEEVQTFPVPMDPPVCSPAFLTTQDGTLVSYLCYSFEVMPSLAGEDFFCLLAKDSIHLFLLEDGQYIHQFSVPSQEANLQTYRPGGTGLWNGEKLALAKGTDDKPGLELWVYDEKGSLLYHGKYVTSLEEDAKTDQDTVEYWEYSLYLLERAELTLGWVE